MAKSQTQIEVNRQKRDLQKGSDEIRALSAQIDNNLKLAQDWFAKLEGRVETEVQIKDPHPDPNSFEPPYLFQLRLAKPNWILEGRYLEVPPWPSNYRMPPWLPVLSASMFVKMSAMHALPELHAMMLESQATYINQIRQANAKFGEFARTILRGDGEGA